MLRVLGIPVSGADARHLIATMIVEGSPDALTAAAQLATESSAICTRSA